MDLLTWIAIGAALTFLALFIAYRIQIRKLCRQLAFLRSHNTNMRISSGAPFSELRALTEEMNEVVSESRTAKRAALSKENDLKRSIANLSHDIRTPLTSLEGYFQLLSESTQPEDRQRYLTIIRGRIDSLKNMLEALFTYTKLQDEAYVLPVEPMNFSKTVYDTMFSFYEEFKAKGIEPEIHFSDERLYIQANEKEIQRVLQNVLKNALLHGNDSISVSLRRAEKSVCFSCSNNLLQPEKIDMSQLFTRFYKADTARSGSSTGLGLSISKELTERMGGTMKASVDNGRFSIHITFPLSDEQPDVPGKQNLEEIDESN